jgi:hypothetical protein
VDRCALFVDAGYVLADGAMAVHGTRQRDSVSWDYAGLVKLLTGVSRDRTGLPMLRCYWYEATVEGRRNSEHNALADLPGVKLRMGRMRPGRREGVEAEMHRDLTTLARNHAVSDAVVVSAEEDLAEVVAEVQDLGLRVIIVHIAADGNWTISRPLRQECDDIVEITAAHLRPFVDLIAGAEPADHDDQYRNGSYQRNGHGPGYGAVTHQGLPAPALPAPPGIYTGPVVEEYQRTAQPSGQGPLALSALAAAAAVAPPPTHHPPAAGRSPEPGRGRAASQDQAGAPDLGPAQPQGAAPQAAQPQAAAPAAAQDQGGPADPALASQPLAAPTPAPGYGAQPGDQMSGPAGYGYGPGPGADDRRGPAQEPPPGRQGGPVAQPQAGGPPPMQQAPVSLPQNPPPSPDPARQNSFPQNAVPQNSLPQNSLPQNSGPPNMAPHNALPQRAAPQNPVPQDGMPRNALPQNSGPQNSLPQNSLPQNHVPQGPVPPAHAQQGRPAQHLPAEPGLLQPGQAGQNSLPPAMSPAPVPQPLPPGQAEPRFAPGQGDYRPPDQAGPRGGPAGRDRMAPPGPEAAGRPTGPQYAESGPPGRFADSPPAPPGQFAENGAGRFGEAPAPGRFPEGPAQARFGEGPAPARFAEGQAPGRFAAGPGQALDRFGEGPGQALDRFGEGPGQALDRFGEGHGPGTYQPAPPGAYGPGGPDQGSYPQFPGSPPPGQHAAPGPESGYGSPQRDQGPYSGPQSAAHAALAQPVPQPVAISLADAVQAAHAEGFGFGDAVARDAPALWLEAVLARKPRMPSDLEARLLQGSALPIDSLLHDEVRHSLRRGFWDALERSRR